MHQRAIRPGLMDTASCAVNMVKINSNSTSHPDLAWLLGWLAALTELIICQCFLCVVANSMIWPHDTLPLSFIGTRQG